MKKILLLILAGVFVAVETVLAVFILLGHANNNVSAELMYSVVVSAFIFALAYTAVKRGFYLHLAALFFTVIADIFLILWPLDDFYLLGVLIFCCAQFFYMLETLRDASGIIRAANLFSRLPLFFFFEFIFYGVMGGSSFGILEAITAFYYGNLVANVIFAFVKVRKSPLFAIGLLLFALCDLMVGINNASNNLPALFTQILQPNVAFWVWLFYVPSQTLIALSLFWTKPVPLLSLRTRCAGSQ